MRVRSAVLLLGVLVLCCITVGSALAVGAGTAFTYQGKLTNAAGAPVDGSADFRFTLWDSASGGTQVGSAVQLNAVPVSGGLFTVALDFGASAFTGPARWLQIEVGSSPVLIASYTLLGPRVQIVPVPYALYALTTGNSNADTVDGFHAGSTPIANGLLPLNANGKFPNSVLSTGMGGGLNADLLDGQHSAYFQDASNLNTGVLLSGRLAGTYSEPLTFSSASNVLAGNGASLFALNASNLSQGTLPSSRLSGTYPQILMFTNTSNILYGNGANLTNLNAANLTGSIADARLSTDVAMLSTTQTFTGAKTFSNALNSFTGSGAGLTNLNAANLTGSIADARLSTNIATLSGTQTFAGAKTFSSASNSFTGNGAGLTALNASNLSTGTVTDGRLSSNVPLLNRSSQTFTGSNTFGTDVRSPIFYDSNNTGYYVDPASTSVLNNLSVNGTLTAAINLSGVTVPDGSLSSNVVLLNRSFQTFTADNYFTGKVGIGTTSSWYKLHVEHSPSDVYAPVIYGKNTNASGSDGIGVLGESKAAEGAGIGVKGIGGSTGVRGEARATGGRTVFGVRSLATTGSGGSSYGLHAGAEGGATTYGIYAYGSGGTTNYAGYFQGNVQVNGTVTAYSKSFKIDHPLDPENKTLTHFCIEGPEMMNVYSGNVVTGADGYATVRLPDYFEAANKDFRYQLTVVDDSDDFVMAKVVGEVEDNRFTIRTSRPSVKVSWQVTGVRNDKWAQGNSGPVEQMKPASEKGKYLSPEAFGKPREMGIGYVSAQEARGVR